MRGVAGCHRLAYRPCVGDRRGGLAYCVVSDYLGRWLLTTDSGGCRGRDRIVGYGGSGGWIIRSDC